MGGTKLSIELIKTEKGRQATFQNRKIGLQKKSFELSTLCGVKVCMIINGPKAKSPEIWPANEDEVKEMIESYKRQAYCVSRTRTVDVSHYFTDRQKKAEAMLSKIQKENDEAKYPTWDYRYNDLSETHLRNFGNYLDGKIKAGKARIAALKGKAASTMTSHSDSILLPDDHLTNCHPNVLDPSLPSRIMDNNACSSSHTNTNYYSNMLEPSLPSGINMDITACSSSYINTNYYTNLLESSEVMNDDNRVNLVSPNSNYFTIITNVNQLRDSESKESLAGITNKKQLMVLNPQPPSSVNGQVQDTINLAPQQGGLGGGLPFDTNNAPQFMNPSMMMLMNGNEPSGSNFWSAPMIGPIYYDPTMLNTGMPTVSTPTPTPTPIPMPMMMPVPMPMPMYYPAFMQPQYVLYPSGRVEGSAQLHASEPNGRTSEN